MEDGWAGGRHVHGGGHDGVPVLLEEVLDSHGPVQVREELGVRRRLGQRARSLLAHLREWE